MKRLALTILPVLCLACGGPSGKARPYSEPDADQLVLELGTRADRAQSFMTETRMEYWSNGQRLKPRVLVMGARGARLRLNALSPAGGSVSADLACDGEDFQFVDFDKNCQRSGACNKDSIAQLIGVSLDPNDFLLLAIGSTPTIDSPRATLR